MNDNIYDEDLRRRDAIDGEAAAWVVRLDGGSLSAADRAAFAAWLARDPGHAAAFAYACDLWGDPAWKSLATELLSPSPSFRRAPRRRAIWASALAAGLALFAVLGWQRVGDPWTALNADYRSARGEVRALTLDDGSLVQLNTASAIAVDYDGQTRRVRLLAGEALFAPSPLSDAERRPFVVAAGEMTARALGTRFVVAREPDSGVSVAVLEHEIEVEARDAEGTRERVTLSPGQSLRYAAAQLGTVRETDVAHIADWSRGQLLFDRVPLSQAVAALNRYRAERIVVTSDELARRRVSGLFKIDDLSGALDVIAAELGARSVRVPLVATLLY
ncbi:MAG: FecR family protein [Alphaproteobacteria bacterium]